MARSDTGRPPQVLSDGWFCSQLLSRPTKPCGHPPTSPVPDITISPAVIHHRSQHIVDLRRAPLEAVVHVHVVLVVVFELLHDVLEVRVFTRRSNQRAFPYPALSTAQDSKGVALRV